MKIAVLGAGAWGTALAIHFARFHAVSLWSRDAQQASSLQSDRENTRYLKGATFPDSLTVTSDLIAATSASDLILVVTPMSGLRPSLTSLVALNVTTPVLWACKGLEASTMLLGHQIADAILPASQARGVLTGPSFAQEVAAGLPAALTLASEDGEFAADMAAKLHSNKVRIYSSTDIVGAEIGGAVKNVMAIAAGVSDGLKLGHNARAAMVTRGLAEIIRFGTALGAQASTFTGLSGLGDLLLTCTGDLSRNRRLGLMLAEGKSLEQILEALGHVAEGVPTAREVLRQAAQLGVDMPITAAVCAMLFDSVSAKDAVDGLMARMQRDEGR
ncbi:NAD(P)-dependent glycerol-3-phosphate dehydrogenase [Burkholderiaceae bacterium DAT-1]|nr:NAD(P)-dependent glycerol-3-phosphate dehydrogenase [Burkholderiaceae bacterium DAT-1]